jgi:hypothetical protein
MPAARQRQKKTGRQIVSNLQLYMMQYEKF